MWIFLDYWNSFAHLYNYGKEISIIHGLSISHWLNLFSLASTAGIVRAEVVSLFIYLYYIHFLDVSFCILHILSVLI